MKIHLLFAFFLCLYILPFEVVAQQNGKITGTVRDDKQTLPSVSVLLYSAKDSVLVTTGMTDGEGKFNLPAVPGAYYVLSTFVGYNKVKTPVFELKGSTYELPAIVLKENTNKLNEVSITASKPVLERKGDKLIFNIEATPSAAGLNGLEVLRKAPGVTIDHNENISLAGKGNVLVTIDGKQTYLSSAEVVSLLKSMPSSEIESIEIINNPGARYDANSTGGIINIKTKKSLAIGFNGNLTLGVGYNKRLQADPGINLNYRRQFFNVFGSYDYNRWPFQENLTIDRVTPGMNSKQLYFSQRNRDTSVFASNNFKIGTDFFLTKNHTIGVLLKGNLNGFDQNGFSRITIGDSFAKPDSILQTPGKNSTDRKNFSYNINYKGILDTAGQEITIDADYSTFNGDNKASFVNRFFLPDGTFFKDGQIYRNFSPSDINIKAIKADYVLPLNKVFKLETGIKVASVKSDNNFVYENDVNGEWIKDNSRSNRFKYDEQVSAAYAILNISTGKFSVQTGLRAERTQSTGNSVTINQLNKRTYTDFFPSLTFSRNFDADNVASVSYSRKINRPNYQNLNPFIFYLDQYTYNEGNPNLKPEYSTNFEATYLWKQKYSVALAYSHTSDVITQILLQNEAKKSMYQTVLNLASNDVVSLTLNFPVKISKWWNLNNNLVGYHKQIQAPDLNGTDLNSKQFSASLYTQNNFTLNKLFSADASVYASTAQIDGGFKVKSMLTADAGLRYSFPNQNGNLKLGVGDIFHSQRGRVFSTLAGNVYNLEQWGTSTNVRLTFTYRFGKTSVKSERSRQTGLDAEQKRLGGK